MIRTALLTGTVAILLLAGVARSEDPKVDPKPGADVEKTPPEVEHWVRKLSDQDALVREEAVRKLVAIGKPAIPAVTAAVDIQNLETINRGMSVLGELYKSADAATKTAAEDALRKLATGTNKLVARRAQGLLGERRPQENPLVPFGGPLVQGRNHIRIRNVNGDLQIDASEDGREISISKKASGEIEMSVTEPGENRKPGKTTRYAARDLDELTKKHPEAAKLYEKYSQRQANFNVMINGQVVPGAVRVFPRAPFAVLKPLQQDLAQARNDLKKTSEKLKELSKTKSARPDELEALSKDLDASIQRIDELRAKLEGLTP